MTEAQITQLIGVLSLLVTTINGFVLWWISDHQKQVKADLDKYNGTVLKAINSLKDTPQ